MDILHFRYHSNDKCWKLFFDNKSCLNTRFCFGLFTLNLDVININVDGRLFARSIEKGFCLSIWPSIVR